MSIYHANYAAYSGLSDEALCVLVRQGDRDAEETLVSRYNRLVRQLARPYFLAGGDSDDEYERISTYLTRGDASGVWYEYWAGNTDDEPALRLYGPTPGEEAVGTIRLENAPRLSPNFARLLGITENPEPAATVTTYNYSSIYME